MTAGVDAAWAAADRYDWAGALELFRELDADGRLAAADLERYSEAARWTGDVEGAVSVMERAFKAHLEGEDPRGAARAAIELCIAHTARGSGAVASGRGERAFKLLESEPPCSEWAGLLDVALHEGERVVSAARVSPRGPVSRRRRRRPRSRASRGGRRTPRSA